MIFPTWNKGLLRKEIKGSEKILLMAMVVALSLEITNTTARAKEQLEIEVEYKIPSIAKITDEKVEKSSEKLVVTVKTYEDYKAAMFQLYTKLPQSMSIKTSISEKEIKEFRDMFEDELIVSDLPNYHLLASYKRKKLARTLFLQMIVITNIVQNK